MERNASATDGQGLQYGESSIPASINSRCISIVPGMIPHIEIT